jgi:hypothetical protein
MGYPWAVARGEDSGEDSVARVEWCKEVPVVNGD